MSACCPLRAQCLSLLPFRSVGGGARMVPSLQFLLAGSLVGLSFGGWICCHFNSWTLVPAWCPLDVPPVRQVSGACPAPARLACLVVAGSLCLLVCSTLCCSARGNRPPSVRLPCLPPGAGINHPFGWWAAVPTWWSAALHCLLLFEFAAFSAGGRRCPHGACSALLAC